MHFKSQIFPLSFLTIATIPFAPAKAATITTPASGLTVSLDQSSGAYSVKATNMGWSFGGTLASLPTQVTTAKGQDKLGPFQEIRFQWTDDSIWSGAIRSYDNRPLIAFRVGTDKNTLGPTPDFPNFSSFPRGLHTLSFQDSVFAPPSFRLAQTSTPWFFFDDAGQTAVLSPASDFIVSQMHGDGVASIGSGLNAQVGTLPAGFAHTSFLVFEDGITKSFKTWGDAITALSGKAPTTDGADELVKYLGYWTDNGGFYYYNYDKNVGYTATLLDLKKKYQANQIPIRYMQLDSWWYQKSLRNSNGSFGAATKNADLPVGTWNAYGGTLDYSASPILFPKGLESFHQDIDLPFAVHGRWIDPTGPYRKKYLLSGVAPVDSKWWEERMAYLKASGVKTYEQDWLNEIYGNSPAMARDLKVGPAFADNMAQKAKDNGLTLQYCMATPRFFMQGSNYPNLTTIRTSEDRFERNKWNNFLYTSLYADAMHIRPWTDVFLSTELGNLTIASLSSGPVGVGDESGKESKANLMTTTRADGVLLKTNAPLLPTDASILADARGEKKALICSTFTDNGQRVAYVFAYPRRDDDTNFSFTPASLGLTGSVYVYDLNAKTAKQIDASMPIADKFGQQNWAAYQIAPVGQSGLAFMGDTDKIIGTGRQRISSVKDEKGQLTVNVVFAANESFVTLHGYSDTAPTLSWTNAAVISPYSEVIIPLKYSAETKEFSFTIGPLKSKTTLIDGEPVRSVSISLKTK